MQQGFRKIASGSTTVPANTTATLTTATRNAGETHLSANEFLVKARNANLVSSRTVDWCVIGVIP